MGCFKDLSGKKIGTLIILNRALDRIYINGNRKTLKVMYNCRCNCGIMLKRSSEYLLKKKIPSCSSACRRLASNVDLKGWVSNSLTVLDGPFVKNTKQGIVWYCICKCGNTLNVITSRLINKKAISCSNCSSRNTISKYNIIKKEPHNKLPAGEAALNGLYASYKRNAKNKGFIFLLSKQEFKFITSQNCFYCDSPPSQQFPFKSYIDKMKKTNKSINGFYIYNGIDRQDNNQGYILNNCVAACNNCNYIKSDWNVIQLKQHLIKMMIKMEIKE